MKRHATRSVRLLVGIAGALLVAAAALAATLYAGSDTAGNPPRACRDWVAAGAYRAEIHRARTLVARMKRAFAAPGLSVAIAADGKLVWSHSCGFADLTTRRRVSRMTQFRIGSVSKTLTAALAAHLEQQGALDLDADVREYVPSFPRERPRVTLRQLGGHLGGVRHYEHNEALNTRHYDSVAASLRVFIDDPLVAAPGTQFHYSSYGFNLLGAAAATAAGGDFARGLREQLLEPLAMKATAAVPTPRGGTRFYEVTRARRAVRAPRVDLSDRYPSGGVLSTAEDLVRFGIGITDPSFLKRQARTLLFTSQRTKDGKPTAYGFGFEVALSPLGPLAGHTGNVVGGTAFLLIHPKTRVVIALTTNVGFVTTPAAPDLADVPEPPELVLPFIRRVLAAR